ncbi:hypothetical protein BDI4_450015 [Burkholderia diffusa]|nr:hypothetical protein BDI4_450015 [Burkholderia diffusa]
MRDFSFGVFPRELMRCQDGIFWSVEFPFTWVSNNMPNEMSIIYLQNCLSILCAKERREIDDCRFPGVIDNPINIRACFIVTVYLVAVLRHCTILPLKFFAMLL